jgi:hypothetical protein
VTFGKACIAGVIVLTVALLIPHGLPNPVVWIVSGALMAWGISIPVRNN